MNKIFLKSDYLGVISFSYAFHTSELFRVQIVGMNFRYLFVDVWLKVPELKKISKGRLKVWRNTENFAFNTKLIFVINQSGWYQLFRFFFTSIHSWRIKISDYHSFCLICILYTWCFNTPEYKYLVFYLSNSISYCSQNCLCTPGYTIFILLFRFWVLCS